MQNFDRTLNAVAAVERLREFIADGDYKVGSKLPAERELTENLSMTRTELRKALGTLEREGTVWRHVGKGTFVSDGVSTQTDDALIGLGRKLTPYRMMRARMVIEPAISREAAVNATGEDLEVMQNAMRRMRSATTWSEYEEQDDLLHHLIAQSSDNLLLVSLFDQLNHVRRAVAWGNVVRKTTCPERAHISFEEHHKIVTAISDRDPEAAYTAMREHLRSVSGRLFKET